MTTWITPLLLFQASLSPTPVKYSSGSSANPIFGSTLEIDNSSILFIISEKVKIDGIKKVQEISDFVCS